MGTRDPHRFVNDLDESAVERLIGRLESRARDPVFSTLFDRYVQRLVLSPSAKVLEIGCGTGAMMRRLARVEAFSGTAIGLDQSPAFIAAAARYASQEGVDRWVQFRVGDAHELEFPQAFFDTVIAHTVISHVTEPERVLREMARVVRPGGTMVIFDGDYCSLTYAYADRDLGRRMDVALANATFNNPWIVRELPSLLPRLGLKLENAWGDAVAEVGGGSYFRSFADTYAPVVVQAELVSEPEVEAWLAAQHQAIEAGTFFAACNYYTYFVGHA